MEDLTTFANGDDQRFTALVVDDDAFSRGTATRILRMLGAGSVMEAADGEQALGYFAALDRPPDVILCDLKMPLMDGIEVVRVLSAWGSITPIILVSGTDGRVLHSAQQVAAHLGTRSLRAIPKPLTPGTLQAALSELGIKLGTFLPTGVGQPPSQPCRTGPPCVAPGMSVHPRVRLASGLVTGAQLVQTQDEVRLPPEVTGWSDPTRTMLTSLADCLSAWRVAGGVHGLSFRLPADSVAIPDLPRRIEAVAEGADLSPGHLTIGIPSEGWHAHASARELVVHLSLMGFRLRLEGFGPGTSGSLALEAPFDEIGIDPRLATAAMHDARAAADLATAIALAENVGAVVDCGGIDTPHQRLFLQRAGCSTGWGAAIAGTIDALALAVWLVESQIAGGGGASAEYGQPPAYRGARPMTDQSGSPSGGMTSPVSIRPNPARDR